MKTPIELISHLDKHAKKGRGALLIVGFPRTTRFVPSHFIHRRKILEELLQQGGIPVGILRADPDDDKAVAYCFLEDRIADNWAEPYMNSLGRRLLTAEAEEDFTESIGSIGIEAFRTRLESKGKSLNTAKMLYVSEDARTEMPRWVKVPRGNAKRTSRTGARENPNEGD
jgi:hypothetical protein